MPKGAILYQSADDAINYYIEWLRHETGYDDFNTVSLQEINLSPYNIIILGSEILEDTLIIGSWIDKNCKKLKEKRLIIFIIDDQSKESDLLNRVNNSIPESLKGYFKFFCLPKIMDKKITIKRDRHLVYLLRKTILYFDKKKKQRLREAANNGPIGPILRECNPKFYHRWYYSRKYLRSGKGIEIGPSFLPLDIIPGLEIKYVDIESKDDQLKKYRLLKKEELVNIDIIDDGETLEKFEKESLDFIIANHFIEHAINPVKTIENFLRVLRKKGIIFLCVPNRKDTFDKDRPLTKVSHIIDVYESGIDDQMEQHYIEVVRSIEKLPEDHILPRAKSLMKTGFSIHYHTYETRNFRPIIKYMQKRGAPIQLLELAYHGSITDEFIAILQKTG